MIPNDRSLLAELPRFLTWEGGSDLVRSACTIYVHWAYYKLRNWSEATNLDLYDNTLKLPKVNQQRLLMAPRFFLLMASSAEPGEEEIKWLKQFIDTEHYLCNQEGEYPANSWTALGDYYLPQERPAALPVQAGMWCQDQVFKAPAVGHIVLDAYSPYSTRYYPSYMGEVFPHSFEEVDIIRQRVEQSLRQIESVNRTARLTVDSSTQVINIVRSPSLDGKTASLSMRSMIGRVGLLNVHSDPWTTSKISDAMIHESIHSLIYKLELHSDIYVDDGAAHEVLVNSPWTGRSIQVHSFVHACFVWFGLWCFWNLKGNQEPGAEKFKERAQRGFMSKSPLSSISSEAYEIIQPDVRSLIEEMTEYVQERCN